MWYNFGTVHSSAQHRAVLIIFPLILQTIIIAHILLLEGAWARGYKKQLIGWPTTTELISSQSAKINVHSWSAFSCSL